MGINLQYSAGQKTSLNVFNKRVCPRDLATVLLKLCVWLCSIHFEATGDTTSQSSAYLGRDVACGRLADCCFHMLVNQYIAMIVRTLTEVFATKENRDQG